MLNKRYLNASQGVFSVNLPKGQHTIKLLGYGLKIRRNFAESISAEKRMDILRNLAQDGITEDTLIDSEQLADKAINAGKLFGISPDAYLWQFSFIESGEVSNKPTNGLPSYVKEIGKSYPVAVVERDWVRDVKGQQVTTKVLSFAPVEMPETVETAGTANATLLEKEVEN
jgi:hypothetical protein